MFNSHLPPLKRIFQGNRLSLLVLGRSEIPHVWPQVPFLVISITDPGKPEAEIVSSDFLRGVLRLKFDDVEGREIGLAQQVLMDETDAQRILEFVKNHLSHIHLIICQCEAGVSRSAGVAAALSRLLQNEDRFFFDHYWPNRLVYRLLVETGSRFQVSGFRFQERKN